jgi:hypothetical protein
MPRLACTLATLLPAGSEQRQCRRTDGERGHKSIHNSETPVQADRLVSNFHTAGVSNRRSATVGNRSSGAALAVA